MKHTFEYVTETALSHQGMSLKNKALFHYFNPHGLYALKKKSDQKISELVDAGKVKSGWIIAYGSFNNFYSDRLSKLAMRKNVERFSLLAVLEGLQNDIRKAEEKIKTIV